MVLCFVAGAVVMGVIVVATRDLPPPCRDGQVALRESGQEWACFDVQEITLQQVSP